MLSAKVELLILIFGIKNHASWQRDSLYSCNHTYIHIFIHVYVTGVSFDILASRRSQSPIPWSGWGRYNRSNSSTKGQLMAERLSRPMRCRRMRFSNVPLQVPDCRHYTFTHTYAYITIHMYIFIQHKLVHTYIYTYIHITYILHTYAHTYIHLYKCAYIG